MGFTDLVVYLDGSSRCENLLEVAILVANRHGAKLSGFHVIGLPLPTQTGIDLAAILAGQDSAEILSLCRHSGAATAHQMATLFVERMRREKLSSDWQTTEGMVSYSAALYARQFDLTVVGQIDTANPPLGTRRMVPETLLLQSGRPVLVIPCVGWSHDVGTNVIVGWDGSPEASRALNDAMPFLKMAASVTLTNCGIGEGITGGNEEHPSTILPHLARHGVRAKTLIQNRVSKSVGVTLLDTATRIGADLLVVGGYGRSRLWESMLGGTTRTILREMNIPVLFSH